MALVGRGAMGEVYLGREANLERTVAVKRVNADMAQDPTLLQRFVTEAQVTAQLDHPAIVPVYGLERGEDGALSYAMKLVRGITLGDFLAEARTRPDAAHSLKARIETFIPVLNALAYAHRRGVVHRDLKPDNIMVGRFGEVLVMDWGIARLLGKSGDPDATAPPVDSDADVTDQSQMKLTLAGTVLGTPAYMSPEQAAGGEVTALSDQYSLGLILQEIVTLRPAMRADTLVEMLAAASKGERAPVGVGRGRAPRELRAIIDKATARDPLARYPSVAALGEDLRRFLRDESVEADPDRGLRRLTRWIGKHRGLSFGLAGGLAALSLSLVLVFVWQGELAVAAEREAARRRERALSALDARIDLRAGRMSERLHRYEALLEGIVAAGRLALTEPAGAPAGVTIYTYANGRRFPPDPPPFAKSSPFYRQPVSLRGGYFAAWGLDPEAMRGRVDQLARAEPAMRAAVLRSIGPDALALSFAAAERRIRQKGAPLVWTYFYTEDGIGVDLPGSWEPYDTPGGVGYDNRREPWYRAASKTHGPFWTVAPDASEFGVTLSCFETVRDAREELLGVAGVDVNLTLFVQELLEIPELTAASAESMLLDDRGMVLIRSSAAHPAATGQIFQPELHEDATLRALIARARSGHRVLADGRLATWTSLASAGLIYLVVGPEAPMLAPFF